ncbi:nuclear transport factor 2 family protein [Streptomyces cylindrosporus]|uniref:Nuclear transport factor 2 family protein n=1 Tax=Streptomyces cylindrosporus TaxID=2927583 RepID=A0ABS9Y854_9ACTN|nr:nuclear transport factor 2 family protein [Streptomyces cylindrosporus]MCI3273411.1 nuclear transport factor 2 family protein [Streptomyces cylindrosporus]
MRDVQEFAEEYFAAATDPDRERYFALFDDDIVVHDDGHSHEGLTAVRRWRTEVPPVRYDLRDVTGTATACQAVAEVSGAFPGSPVTLRFTFERDAQGKITLLDIAP